MKRRHAVRVPVVLVLLLAGAFAGCDKGAAPPRKPAASRPVNLSPTTRAARRVDPALVKRTKQIMGEIMSALDVYELHVGAYPDQQQGGLVALVRRPAFQDEALARKWKGPYLERVPKDPWGNEFVYSPGKAVGIEADLVLYRVLSKGPDGQAGTADDISSFE